MYLPALRSPSGWLLAGVIFAGALGAGYLCFAVLNPSGSETANLLPIATSLLVALSVALGALAIWFSAPQRAWSLFPALTLAAGFCVAGVTCIYAAFRFSTTDQTRELFLTSGVLIGIGVGFAGAALHPRIEESLKSPRAYYGTIVALGVGIPILIWWCGMRQFGGFDHSVVIDYGWRLLNGQRPFRDFPSTAPIGFILGAYYGFLAFGVSWQAVVLTLAAFAFVTFFWSVGLLSMLLASRWQRLVFAFGLQALCLLPVSYWWYNPVTNATGVIFTLSAYVWLRSPQSRLAVCSYFSSLVVLASMKPNVAAALILLTTLVFLTSPEHRLTIIPVSALAMVTFALWLGLHGVSLLACIQGYREVSGRGLELGPFFAKPLGQEQLVSNVALIYVLLPAIGLAVSGASPVRRRAVGIGCAAIVAGLASFITAGENKLVDLALVLFGVVIVSGVWEDSASKKRPALHRYCGAYLLFILLTLSCAGVAVAATRHRVRGIGMNAFYEITLEKHRIISGFFAGLRSGRLFKDTYEQVEAVVQQSTGKSIFFGPRMQWGYAAFRLASPTKQPVWWHPGISYREADQLKYASILIQDRPDVLIFLKNDMVFFPGELLQAIRENYSEDQSFSRLTVFRPKRETADTATVAAVSDQHPAPNEVLTATATIDVPSTPSLGEFGTRVSLPGLTPRDQLIISPTQHYGTWGAYHTSLGILTIVYTNTTPATQDPPPIVFRITALQF